MSVAWWLTADARDGIAAIPDGSIDLVLTSPPFLALRSYLPVDHPDKGKEIGSEATPAEFLSTLLGLSDEFARVLTPHGSICVELGDTYSGSGGAGGDYSDDGLRAGQSVFRQQRASGWPLAKSLTMIPTLYSASLAYGRNLLTGEPCRQWRVRNVVAWVRPNPPVGALGDKFRPATSYMTVACLSGKRWFDLEAVRGEPSPNTHARTAKGVTSKPRTGKSADRDGSWDTLPELAVTAGAPPLDWWCIPPGGYEGSHYAVFPPELLVRPIKAMCPLRVCTVCGKASERIVGETKYIKAPKRALRPDESRQYGSIDGKRHNDHRATSHDTLGWTDCGHNAWRNGRVLDPFGGSGTTAMVTTGHGRDCLSVDLDGRNADLAYERVGGLIFREVGIGDVAGLLAAPVAEEDVA